MNKILLIFTALTIAFSAKATLIEITTSGMTYTPATVTAMVGDSISFTISANHPTVEVSEATWSANGTTALASGFGSHSSNFTFVVAAAPGDTIFYVCTNHVANGMKGMIVVDSPSAIDEAENTVVTVGPNPVTGDVLNYSFTDQITNGTITIYSMTGQIVESVSVKTANGVIPAKFATGSYVLKAFNGAGEEIATKQIVVQ